MSDEKTVTIEVIKDFKFAHRGCDVIEYQAGSTAEVTVRCAEVALAEKWAKATKAKKAAPENKAQPATKAKKAAPENKAQPAAPENKAAPEEGATTDQPVADQSDTPNE